MGNRILYTNQIKTESGTLSASTEATGYEAENLETGNYGQTWRSTTVTAVWIKVDLLSAKASDTMCLGNTNLTASATVTLEANATDSWGSPSYSHTTDATGLDDEIKNIFDVHSNQTYRWWRVTIEDAGNTDGYIEVGEYWIGDSIGLDEAIGMENSRTRVRNNVEIRTEYGQAFIYQRDWRWNFQIRFPNGSETMRDQIRALDLAVYGNAFPFFFVWDDTDPAISYFVRIETSSLTEQQTHKQIYTSSLNLLEESPGQLVPRL